MVPLLKCLSEKYSSNVFVGYMSKLDVLPNNSDVLLIKKINKQKKI